MATRSKAEPEEVTTAVTVIEAPDNITPLRPVDPNAGTYALAMLDDEEFSERLAILKRGRERIATIQRDLMEEDVDYGLIKGTPKPTLFKPGAEKLAQMYGLAARLETTFTPGDGELQPLLKYEASCFLHLGSFDGPIVAVGHGTANGWEKRYRREADKACPACGKTALIASKFEPGWYCFPKKGGCGTKFGPDDERISGQASDSRGDPVAANDLQNTLLKMAEKRAFVDAVLRATASSGLFTQDVAEDKAERSDYGPLPDLPPSDYVEEEPVQTVTAGGAVVNTDGEVIHQPEPEDAPVPEVKSATGTMDVGRGGHSGAASSAQIASIKAFSKGMKLGPEGLAKEIDMVLPTEELYDRVKGQDAKTAAATILELLTALSEAEAGAIVTHLRKRSAGS